MCFRLRKNQRECEAAVCEGDAVAGALNEEAVRSSRSLGGEAGGAAVVS